MYHVRYAPYVCPVFDTHLMYVLCSADEADRAETGTVGVQGILPSLHHLRVTL